MAIIDTRQVRLLEAEVKKLKADKEKTEERNKILFNEQIGLLESIAELKGVRESEKKENEKIYQETIKAKGDLANIKVYCQDEQAKLDVLIAAQDNIYTKFDEREKELSQRDKASEALQEAIAQDKKKNSEEKELLSKWRTELTVKENDIARQYNIAGELQGKASQAVTSAERKKQELDDLLKHQKVMNDALVANLRESENIKAELASKQVLLNSSEDSYVKLSADMKLKIEDTEKLKALLDQEYKGIDRIKAQLDNDKKTIEIERLRVNKLIRDNQLEEKLAKMKQNL